MDCSLSASSVHGILQGRILEWVAIPYSRGSSQPRDQTWVSCVSRIGRPILYHWCHWEPSISLSLLRFLSIQLVMPPNHLILCCHLLLFPSIFPSIRVFSSESVLCIRYCQSIGASASASILPKNTQSWFPLGLTGLRVQGTLKTLPNKLPNQMTQQWNHIDNLYTWDLLTYLFIYLFVDLLAMQLVGSNQCPPQWEYPVPTAGNCLHMRFSAPLLCMCACMLNCFSHVWLFVTPWTIVRQAPLSMGILQARILEWVARPSSRGSSQPRDWTCVTPALQGNSLLMSHQGSPTLKYNNYLISKQRPEQKKQAINRQTSKYGKSKLEEETMGV